MTAVMDAADQIVEDEDDVGWQSHFLKLSIRGECGLCQSMALRSTKVWL